MVQAMPSLLQSESANKIIQQTPKWVTLILLVLIAWSMSSLVWSMLLPDEAPPNQSTLKPGPQSRADNISPDTNIAQYHLFGIAGAKKEEQTIADAPDTRLNLKLHGVFAPDDEKQGYALIASGNQPEKLIHVGDKLPGNIELKAVYPDRVIISRSGKAETLRLPASKSTGISYSQKKRGNNSLPATSNLSEFRRQITRDPAKLAELINTAPARRSGRFVGYRITTLKQHPILSALDIRSGDIVTQVNGIQINSPASGMKALTALSRAKQLSLTIDRNGQTMEVNQSF